MGEVAEWSLHVTAGSNPRKDLNLSTIFNVLDRIELLAMLLFHHHDHVANIFFAKQLIHFIKRDTKNTENKSLHTFNKC